jgi:dihydrofolate synthase/folylpolyglutamate synthase
MNYQEFLDHIYRKYSGNVKLELDRMANLLKDMGNPQNSLRGFHVAGTNGKGSVCAALEAISLAHGFSTGLNTSPHLIDYTERFRLNGRDVDFNTVLDLFHLYEKRFLKWDASFFEISTAIAFALFKLKGAHTSVIEVGLGGRLDATNLFTPDVSAITTIGLDHVKTLGRTLTRIAAEKAGIVKAGVPLVLGEISARPRQVILARAEALNAPVWHYGRDFKSRVRSDGISGLCFDYSFGGIGFKELRAALIGEHQAANLSVALTAFILYARKLGLEVSEAAVRKGLARINWKGRMQVLSSRPPIIVDGAHNVQGIRALVRTLRRVFPSRRFVFLLSILADKDYSEMISLICSVADKIYLAQNGSERAATVEEQAIQVRKHDVSFQSAGSVAEAYRMARAGLAPGEVLICGGSLYTVGEVLQAEAGTSQKRD